MEGETDITLLFWLGTLVMLLLALCLLFVAFFSQFRYNKMVLHQTEALYKASLSAETRERKRIAADLHDSVSGDLTAIRNFVKVLQIQKDNYITAETLQDLSEAIQNALNSTREVSYKLMPPLIEQEGLAAAVADYFKRINLNHQTVFNLGAENFIDVVPQTAYEIFKIIQELCTNILKHGNATNCSISLKKDNAVLVVTVIDNGVSFDYNNPPDTGGAGIMNIRYRLQFLKAEFCQNRVESGNKFTIIITL
jgi:signal transduction histidine kinase